MVNTETDANKWMFDFKEKKFQGYVVKNHPSKEVKKKKNTQNPNRKNNHTKTQTKKNTFKMAE